MEDGKWRIENREWKREKGEWRMEKGEWKRSYLVVSYRFLIIDKLIPITKTNNQ